MSLKDEAAKGRREGLVALRGILADALDGSESKDVRSLSAVAGRFCKVLEEIDSLAVPEGSDVVSKLRAQRSERLSSIVDQAQRSS